MTEGVTAALLVVAAALAARGARGRAGVAVGRRRWASRWGVATLVRPQSLVLAPVLGALALPGGGGARARGSSARLR